MTEVLLFSWVCETFPTATAFPPSDHGSVGSYRGPVRALKCPFNICEHTGPALVLIPLGTWHTRAAKQQLRLELETGLAAPRSPGAVWSSS